MHTYNSLLDELERGLIEIDKTEKSTINKCSDKIKLCQDLSSQLRVKYLNYDFNSNVEEIHFFKEIKPVIHSELQFQVELLSYLKNRPKGSLKVNKQFINTSLDMASIFISTHGEFDHYIKIGSTHLDEIYFTRRSYDPNIHGHLSYPGDPEFSSPADDTLSCLQAAHRYVQFLKNEHFTLKNPNLDPTWENMKFLRWQKTKTDLVELIYGLHESKSINGDLKDVIEAFERLFKVDLGNFYRTYTDIKYKKDPTSFINELKNSMLEKMEKDN